MAKKRAAPKKGFQKIMGSKVKSLAARGNRTASGKKIANPRAYIGAGLRKAGIAKLGAKKFAARTRAGSTASRPCSGFSGGKP